MKTSALRIQRIRTLAMTAGMVLGMTVAALAPQMSHAAVTKASKGKAAALAERTTQLPDASPEQLQAADRVLTGAYQCEFGQRVSVDRNSHQGYFDMKLGRQAWVMKPVQSATGAIRLEDVKGNALLIQILTKSMVMDPKAGRRLVDGCVHDVQRAAEADLSRHPRPSIFGAPADGQ
ncbi:MAG TPA: hypothetical protein VEQ09_08580 [Aquabacterium sp.]|nr:hypothetical protein [Aquabacterium sp.]